MKGHDHRGSHSHSDVVIGSDLGERRIYNTETNIRERWDDEVIMKSSYKLLRINLIYQG